MTPRTSHLSATLIGLTMLLATACSSGDVTPAVSSTPAAGVTAGAPAEGGPPDGAPADGGAREGGTADSPDLSDAASRLGVSLDELQAAIGGPPPDLEAAAQTLGISIEDLQAVLPAQPDGARP